MKATSAVFRSFLSSHSTLGVHSFTFKLRNITLRLTPYSQGAVHSSNGVLRHWIRVSRDLNHLRELAFLGRNVWYTGRRDVLQSLPPKARLRRFMCEDDHLLDDSLNSLCNHQKTLEDFGGFFDIVPFTSDVEDDPLDIDAALFDIVAVPFDIEAVAPRITLEGFLEWFYNVRTLEVGMKLVVKLRNPGQVTHLSVRLQWESMLPAIGCVSKVFGWQVRALRLEREAVADGGPTLEGFKWVSGIESPLWLCAALDMPTLRYLEVRDSAPPEVCDYSFQPHLTLNFADWSFARVRAPLQQGFTPPDASMLGHPRWLSTSDGYEGVRNLDRLAWRPAWAAQGAKHRTCADVFTRTTGDVLPLLTVWMSLEARTSGIWDTWTRFDEDLQLERQCIWNAVKDDSWKRMA